MKKLLNLAFICMIALSTVTMFVAALMLIWCENDFIPIRVMLTGAVSVIAGIIGLAITALDGRK